MKKQILFFVLLVSLLGFGLNMAKVRAQETINQGEINAGTVESSVPSQANPISPVEQISEIKAQDLGVSESTVLPTSRFYFLKNLWRGVNLFVTRDPAKKAELNLKYANEKLMEVKKMIENRETKVEIIEKQLKNYQNDLEKTKEQIEKLKENKEAIKEKLQEKYIEHSLKQQMVLQKLANQVPADVYEKIEENRQQHLEKLGEVMAKVAEKQDIVVRTQEIVQKIIEAKPTVPIQVVEIFKNLEERVPENIKSRVEEIKDRTIKNAAEKIKLVPPEERKEMIEKQLKNVANPITATEIANDITKVEPTLKTVIEETKTKPVEDFLQEKLKNLPEEKKEKILERIITPVQPVVATPSAPPFFGTEQGKISKESFIPPEQTAKKIEILQGVQQKLLEKSPEPAKAPEVLQKVIDKQVEKLKGMPGYDEYIKKIEEGAKRLEIEKREKELGKPLSEEEFIPEGYVYVNKEYGFKLQLKPQKFWQGYKVEKRGPGTGNYATERFEFLVPTETQGWPEYPWASVFGLEIYTPQQWEEVFPKPGYLNKNEKYVYAYLPAQDLPIDVIKRGGISLDEIIKVTMGSFKLIPFGLEPVSQPSILPVKPIKNISD